MVIHSMVYSERVYIVYNLNNIVIRIHQIYRSVLRIIVEYHETMMITRSESI